MIENRAGKYIPQSGGYSTFKPNDLPPQPEITYDGEMTSILSKADQMLGRLDGVTQTLPNPDLFVAMYVRKEAVLSSQIEGTQASLSDILSADASNEKREDVGDVVNYVKAMNYGLERLHTFPLSLRLIREIHAVLLSKGRGSGRNPGEFRTSQNWIGPAGCSLFNASYVPPTVPDMKEALGNLELFLHKEDDIPALVKIALVHAQFESIHPFLDGNGRMGRLLITFWLCQQKILTKPLLYLSYYFKQNRVEYYERLMRVRETGDWEQWIKYFLKGISATSEEAIRTAKNILVLKEQCESKIVGKNNTTYSRMLNLLFEDPIISKPQTAEKLEISVPTANKIVDDFCELGILKDITPDKKRYKRYSFSSYIEMLNRGTEL